MRAALRIVRLLPARTRTLRTLRRRATPSGERVGGDGAGRTPVGAAFEFGKEIRGLRRPEDHFRFFEEHREFIQPSDFCLLLEGLWRQTLWVAGAEGFRSSSRADAPRDVADARRRLFNAASYMDMMKEAVRKLDRFGPEELPRLLGALHAMQWNDKHLLKVAEPVVVAQLPSIALEDMPKLVHSYVSIQCGSRMLFDEFVHRCTQASTELDGGTLVALAAAFAYSPHKPVFFLAQMAPLVHARVESLDGPQLARAARAFAVRLGGDVDPAFVGALASRLRRRGGETLRELPARELCTVLRSLAFWLKHHPRQRGTVRGVFRLAAAPLLAHREELSPKLQAIALWSFGKAAVVLPELFEALYSDLSSELSNVPETALASCLLASARLIAGPWARATLPKSETEHGETPTGVEGTVRCRDLALQFLKVAEGHVQKVIGNIKLREVTTLVLTYTLARSGSADLFAVLQRAVREQCHDMPMEQTSSVLWSFATMRLGSSVFREVQVDVLDRINQISAPAACDIIWAYCVVKHYEPAFFRALLATLVPSRLARQSRCALLHPALLEVRAQLPDMDPDGLERYMGYVLGAFRRSQLRAAPPQHILDGIAGAIVGSGLAEPQLLADADGYVVDVLVPGSGAECSIAVLYHSDKTLHPLSGEPLGQTMMRQRHLKRLGFNVINLWDRSWLNLSSADRCKLLRKRLRPASFADPGAKKSKRFTGNDD